ncbi:MAG TPA: serine hydrolase domain-containing protein [Thermoanaerobaculia bacterium]|nr:serine hydrolase domain-containing protein [Thermoanaerobaculia bacterium]
MTTKPTLKIIPLLLALTVPVALAQPPAAVKRPDAELRQELDRLMSRLEAFGFSGSLLVARDGRVILEKGYGFADRDKGVPFTAETVFDIGSITKQLTAAAILKLEMEGKLKVTDPLSKHFEGVPEDKRGITLHHLLTHSAGFVDILGGDYDEMPRDRLVQGALASKLLWPPGTGYEYSNLGYSLLAIVVEKVSGRPYETFLQERLLKPAGLTLTGYRGPKWDLAKLAHGYSRRGPWGTPLDHTWAPDGPWWNLRGNGGILSTVGELYKWHRALEGEAILSKEAKAKYQAPHVAEGGGTHYGYGWSVAKTSRGTTLVAHNGGNGIFAADFRRYVDEGVVIAIGSNRSDFSSIATVPLISRLVFGGDVQMPPEPMKMETKALERYLGSYALPSGGRLVVSAAPASTGDPRYPGVTIAAEGTEAFFLLLGGTRDPEKTREVDNRLLAALEEGRKGSPASIGKLFGIPAAQAEADMRNYVGRWEEQHGKLHGFETAGTVTIGERTSSYVRFLFEKGSVLTEFIWQSPETIGNVRPVEEPLSLRFVPSSPAAFASYDPRSRRVSEIGFETGEGGAVKALVVKTATGEVKAKRMENAP